MSNIFRNQILITEKVCENSRLSNLIELDSMIVYYDENIPVIRSRNVTLIGWAWNCLSGKKVAISEIDTIQFNSVIDKTKDFAGRYLIIVEGRYIFSDTTTSYPLYYFDGLASTNISLLADMSGQKISCTRNFQKTLYLPSLTGIGSIKRIIPGEYYDFKEKKPSSIRGFLSHDRQKISIDNRRVDVSNYLKTCANGLIDLIGDDYRLMLTGGKDSRLSLLCLYSAVGNKLKAFTHLKPYFFNDINDVSIPKKLSHVLDFNHVFTRPKKNSFPEEKSIFKHSPMLFGEMQPGSTFYYYLKSNWFQLSEEFLIDNYYEVGRMHLHKDKAIMGSAEKINLENILKSGYYIDRKTYEHFSKHLNLINDGFDALDIFYFIKNFVNVSNQFELIDYSHTPLIFCNSLNFFRSLLSVPETSRKNGIFHMLLIDEMTPKCVKLPECNKNANTKIYKGMRKIRGIIAKVLYKYLQTVNIILVIKLHLNL